MFYNTHKSETEKENTNNPRVSLNLQVKKTSLYESKEEKWQSPYPWELQHQMRSILKMFSSQVQTTPNG